MNNKELLQYVQSLPQGNPNYLAHSTYVMELAVPKSYRTPRTLRKWLSHSSRNKKGHLLSEERHPRTRFYLLEKEMQKEWLRYSDSQVERVNGVICIHERYFVHFRCGKCSRVICVFPTDNQDETTETHGKYLLYDRYKNQHYCQECHTDVHDFKEILPDQRPRYSRIRLCDLGYFCDGEGCQKKPIISPVRYHSLVKNINHDGFDLCEQCFQREVIDVGVDELREYSPERSYVTFSASGYGSMYDWIPIAYIPSHFPSEVEIESSFASSSSSASSERTSGESNLLQPTVIYVNMNPKADYYGWVSSSTEDDRHREYFDMMAPTIEDLERQINEGRQKFLNEDQKYPNICLWLRGQKKMEY